MIGIGSSFYLQCFFREYLFSVKKKKKKKLVNYWIKGKNRINITQDAKCIKEESADVSRKKSHHFYNHFDNHFYRICCTFICGILVCLKAKSVTGLK